MKKMNTSPISGAQELLPAEQAAFNKLKTGIARVYHAHGFQNIETPVIDRTEILLAKAGGDTEKQIYKVVKTAEAEDGADQALRFDHTVPLARYVAEHENDLTFPFRVSQIGRNFRGERAQKGRFREFYQLDADVIGRGSLPVAYDAEVIATAVEALKTFIRPMMVVRISNRKILTGLIRELGLETKSDAIFSAIDHAEKVPPEATRSALEAAGLSDAEIEKLSGFMSIRGSRTEAAARLNALGVENDLFKAGVAELDKVMGLLEKQGYSDIVAADMLIVRGLDYYTGTVFETFLPEYKNIGSICSGGRYENLAAHYTDQQLPGVGVSIGLTRLFYVLNENHLLENTAAAGRPVDVVLIPFGENELEFTYDLAARLRAAGRSVDLCLTEKRIGDRMSYAAKVADFAAVIGENEVQSGAVSLKDLATGEQVPLETYLAGA